MSSPSPRSSTNSTYRGKERFKVPLGKHFIERHVSSSPPSSIIHHSSSSSPSSSIIHHPSSTSPSKLFTLKSHNLSTPSTTLSFDLPVVPLPTFQNLAFTSTYYHRPEATLTEELTGRTETTDAAQSSGESCIEKEIARVDEEYEQMIEQWTRWKQQQQQVAVDDGVVAVNDDVDDVNDDVDDVNDGVDDDVKNHIPQDLQQNSIESSISIDNDNLHTAQSSSSPPSTPPLLPIEKLLSPVSQRLILQSKKQNSGTSYTITDEERQRFMEEEERGEGGSGGGQE